MKLITTIDCWVIRLCHRASNWTTDQIEHNQSSTPMIILRNLLLLVLFLYIIRWPHSRQRMGSRDLISFLAPQSLIVFKLGNSHRIATKDFSPAHRYSMSWTCGTNAPPVFVLGLGLGFCCCGCWFIERDQEFKILKFQIHRLDDHITKKCKILADPWQQGLKTCLWILHVQRTYCETMESPF